MEGAKFKKEKSYFCVEVPTEEFSVVRVHRELHMLLRKHFAYELGVNGH